MITMVHRRPGETTDPERSALLVMLEMVSDEFVPPLAGRRSTTQTDLAGSAGTVTDYLDGMMAQHNILAVVGPRVVGFISFREETHLRQCGSPGVYVSTIATHPAARGLGVGSSLYRELFRREDPSVVVRTWSTNLGHISLMQRLGFSVVEVINDHRGPGVDTVYLSRSCSQALRDDVEVVATR